MKKRFRVLGLLLLSFLGFTAFSSAGSLTYTGHYRGLNSASDVMFALPNPVLGIPSPDFTLSCDFSNFVGFSSMQVNFGYQYYTYTNTNIPGGSIKQTYYSNYVNVYNGNYTYTSDTSNKYIFNSFYFASSSAHSSTLEFDWSCTFQGNSIGNNLPYCNTCPECETCPEVDTGAILSGYIAISDITDNYCISNGLCGEIATGMSTLYINDIWHESKPFLYVNIPEEFDWDYTGNVAQMFINVRGYNTDPDYIAGIINTQNSKPNSTDFNNIVSGLIPLLIPGLVIILFVWFIFKFIKKIF